jgi:hypothetical protein
MNRPYNINVSTYILAKKVKSSSTILHTCSSVCRGVLRSPERHIGCGLKSMLAKDKWPVHSHNQATNMNISLRTEAKHVLMWWLVDNGINGYKTDIF